MAKPVVALQLYTVRDDFGKDPLATLAKVAEIGYPAVQLAGSGGLSAWDMKKALDDLGLKVAGAHVGFDRLRPESVDAEIDFCLAVGTVDVVCAALPQSLRERKPTFLEAADVLANAGRRCKERGARLSYHNHAFEFARFDGQYGLDLLLTTAGPGVMDWEPDVYWIQKGGEDPAAYIRKYAGRCPLIHLKDVTADESATFAEVGEGVLDWPSIFGACDTAGAEWYVVEQDRCARPAIESAALSLRHLKEWGKV